MDLPSTYLYHGWTIQYGVLGSNAAQNADCHQYRKSVVFVHGTPWSSVVFQPVVKALLAQGPYRILMYDLPGYGRSQDFDDSEHSSTTTTSDRTSFAGDTSVKFQASALEALLRHVGMHSGDSAPAVVAHDIAGAIVLRAHLIHGCEFESMMLCDTNVVLPWGDGFYKLARSQPQTFIDLPLNIFEAVVRAVTRSARHNPMASQDVWDDLLALPWVLQSGATPETEAAKRQRSFVRQISQANDNDVAEMLDGDMYGRVRCNVKVIWGEEDQWIPRNKIEEMIEKIGDRVKKCAFIPEAGHLVMLDQPERFAVEVFSWLNGSVK